MVDLSIVIINYNTKVLLKECVESIEKMTKGINFEIIIIDNASSDGSNKVVAELMKKWRNISTIKNNKNLGFAQANNQGIKKSSAPFILLLNSDTLITSNVIAEMVMWMKKNKKIGISSCQLINKDGSFQGTGGYFPTLSKIIAWMFFIEDIPLIDKLIKPFHPYHPNSLFYKGSFKRVIKEQDWVTGAFFLIRREVVDDIGLIDEDYFMYTEEVDFCYRAKQKRWKVFVNGYLDIIHYGGGSGSSQFATTSEFKNILLFYKKHFSPQLVTMAKIILKLGIFMRQFVYLVLNKDKARIYAKAFSSI